MHGADFTRADDGPVSAGHERFWARAFLATSVLDRVVYASSCVCAACGVSCRTCWAAVMTASAACGLFPMETPNTWYDVSAPRSASGAEYKIVVVEG